MCSSKPKIPAAPAPPPPAPNGPEPTPDAPRIGERALRIRSQGGRMGARPDLSGLAGPLGPALSRLMIGPGSNTVVDPDAIPRPIQIVPAKPPPRDNRPGYAPRY